jgi:hypothetical protein
MDANSLSKTDSLSKAFMDSLDEKERMAYHIAKSHLGTMFSLDKSNAYLEWIKTKESEKDSDK